MAKFANSKPPCSLRSLEFMESSPSLYPTHPNPTYPVPFNDTAVKAFVLLSFFSSTRILWTHISLFILCFKKEGPFMAFCRWYSNLQDCALPPFPILKIIFSGFTLITMKHVERTVIWTHIQVIFGSTLTNF